MQYAGNRGVFRVAGVAVALAVTLQGCAATSRMRSSRITPGHNENRTQIVNRWENVAALVGGTSLACPARRRQPYRGHARVRIPRSTRSRPAMVRPTADVIATWANVART